MAGIQGSMRRASAGTSIVPVGVLVVLSMLVGGLVSAVALEATAAARFEARGTTGAGLDATTREYLTRLSAGLAFTTPTSAATCSVTSPAPVRRMVPRMVHVPE